MKKDNQVIPGKPNLERKEYKSGRPKKRNQYRWWDDAKIMAQIETAFKIGATDEEACLSAGISVFQLQYYQREVNPDFKLNKELWKNNPILKARANIIEAMNKKETPVFDRRGNPILDNGEVLKVEQIEDRNNRIGVSKWYLERKKKDEFSLRSEITGKDGKDIIDINPDDPKTLTTLLKIAEAITENDATNNPTSSKKKKISKTTH